MELYLITTVTNGRNLSLEYRMIEMKTDMRKNFCKKNKERIVNTVSLINLVSKYNIKIKGNRVIMPNSEVARKFYKELFSVNMSVF